MSGTEWFGAKVIGVSRGQEISYDLRYDDGDEEAGVSRTKIRHAGEKQLYDGTLPLNLRVDACCEAVVKAKLLPGHANCLPGVVVSGLVSMGGSKQGYEVEFDVKSLDLQLPQSMLMAGREGVVREKVARDKIFTLHGRGVPAVAAVAKGAPAPAPSPAPAPAPAPRSRTQLARRIQHARKTLLA